MGRSYLGGHKTDVPEGDPLLDLCGESVDRLLEEVDVREDLGDDQRVLGVEAPISASLSAGIFLRSLPLASSASTPGSVVPCRARRSSLARTRRGCPRRRSRA